MKSNRTVGQSAISLLEEYGVDTVFGIPGVHTLEFYRGLPGSSLRHVAVRHEQGAGFMADGFARASGKPAACLLITGPGVANAATAIGQAFSDSVPMLVLSSVNATDDLGKGRGRLHEITSQQAAMAPFVAFSRTIHDPETLPQAMADAFAVFDTARPRPVHIEVPLDVLAGPAANGAAGAPVRGRAPQPDPASIARAAELIRSAERPVIIAGGGTVDCADAVRALVAKLGAPVALTTAAKGVVPDDDPLCLGGTLANEGTQRLIGEADVIVAVGTELAETDWWTEPLPLRGKLVRIDLDPATLVRDRVPDVPIQGEAGESLRLQTKAIGNGGAKADDRTEAVATARRADRGAYRALQQKHARVLDALRRALPDDGIVCSDMTQIAYTGNHHFPCSRPRTWFHPVGFGTLGYALPAAIGAKLAVPDRAVVALAGDAGLLFTIQELATAVELGQPLVVLLWNNDALGQIAGDMVSRGIPSIGVRQRNPDFQALAKAFGCHAVRAGSLEELEQQIRDGFQADGPTLVEVREDAPFLE